MRRNFAYPALASAIAALWSCGGDDGHAANVDANVDAQGLAHLSTLSAQPPSLHCVEGSTKVNIGSDANLNGVLGDDEISQTTYNCTGATGDIGPAGRDGIDGED